MRARTGTCALVLWAATASAQVPSGPEFFVSASTAGYQYRPLAALRRDGSFVVVWTDGPQFAALRNGFGRRFDPSGAAVGEEFRVNETTSSVQSVTDIAGGPRDDFIVVWNGIEPGTFISEILARRFDAAGRAQGTAFRVNAGTTGHRSSARVDRRGAGPFVVTWSDELDGGESPHDHGVAARLFDSSGRPLGPEFRVNAYTTGSQTSPDVAMDVWGRFVVVWGSRDGRDGVFARTFEADGTPVGTEFQVNTTTGVVSDPSVDWSPAGGFLVVWTLPNANVDVRARRLDDQGHPVVNEFTVNEVTAGTQFTEVSAIAHDGAGNFVVTWTSDEAGSGWDVFGRRFDAQGNPRGPEFRVNTYTSGLQWQPSVASDAWGNFLVGWTLGRIDGTYDAAAQRFGGLVAEALDVDRQPFIFSDGNGVLERCETVRVEPTWRNRTGAAQTFTAAASIAGPPGGQYSINDASAQYGTVADMEAQRCVDCYVAGACAATRPLTHWDATLTERLIPDAQGQTAPWRLHVGESFQDVPRASPFYRFVETVLHHGVTAGCSGTTFCPGAVTTREQMAVFVLVARENAGYAPPPCTTPLFADVPASSPFCRWIEELARRGVVSGCGDDNYCPSQAVTREQMAVFVLRTLDPALDPPACATPIFADVPASSPFCRWIEDLARRGVVSGCGGGNYCPADPVSREQMAVFISATFGLTLYGP